MKLIMATIRPHKLEEVKKALTAVGVQGMSVSEIRGFGRTGGKTEVYRGSAYQLDFVPKLRIDLVVVDNQVHGVLEALEQSAKTGKIGDGKVFVLNVEEAIRLRTGERGESAL
jgi:nitrogen regulatory protein P-II 1